MRNTNWRPYIFFSMMVGFMLIIGLGYLFTGFSQYRADGIQMSPEVWRSGIWGMWGMGRMLMRSLFMVIGIMFLMLLMRFFFGGMGRRGRRMGWDDPMGWSAQDTCLACKSPIRSQWKVCPHCGLGIQ